MQRYPEAWRIYMTGVRGRAADVVRRRRWKCVDAASRTEELEPTTRGYPAPNARNAVATRKHTMNPNAIGNRAATAVHFMLFVSG